MAGPTALSLGMPKSMHVQVRCICAHSTARLDKCITAENFLSNMMVMGNNFQPLTLRV